MALKAIVGKYRADLPLEIDRRCRALCRGLRHYQTRRAKRQGPARAATMEATHPC